MDLSKVLIWNVRDLNRKARRDAVHDMVVSTHPDLVCLQETKKAAISRRMVMFTLGADFDEFIVLPTDGTRGGILLAWKGCVRQRLNTRIDTCSLLAQFAHEDGVPWWFTGVYGPQSDALKVQFLQQLRLVRQDCTGPRVVGGDFNLIYQAEDKNNSNLDWAKMGRSRRFINDVELHEIPLLGRKFTWSNERESPTLVRLDRVCATDGWDHLFPDCILQSSASTISDHCPLLLGLHEFTHGNRRFHFESFWPRLDGFLEEVTQSWEQPVVASCPQQVLADKFKRLSCHLQSWSQRKVGNIKEPLQFAKEVLHQLEIAQDSRMLSPPENWLRCQLKKHAIGLTSLERTMARLRSRLNWLKEGDTNT
jgi:exonuclease III